MTEQSLTIPLEGKSPAEFKSELQQAITEAMLLIFQQEKLELNEDQNFALYTLTQFQNHLREKPNSNQSSTEKLLLLC